MGGTLWFGVESLMCSFSCADTMVLLLCRASLGFLRCTARLTLFRTALQAFRKGPAALAKLFDDFTEKDWLGRFFSVDAVENLVYAIVYGE